LLGAPVVACCRRSNSEATAEQQNKKRCGSQVVRQRFAKSPAGDGANRDEVSEKQGVRASLQPSETHRFSASAVDSNRLVLKDGTIWDESIAALLRALDKATTSEERLAILAELKAWREGRT
jgi:hypothetical protein